MEAGRQRQQLPQNYFVACPDPTAVHANFAHSGRHTSWSWLVGSEERERQNGPLAQLVGGTYERPGPFV